MEENEKIEIEDHWILNELTYPSKEEIKLLSFREKIWLLFEDPTSSKHAYFLSISIMTMILISGTTFLIETIPGNNLENNSFIKVIETFFVIIFTIEYIGRFLSCPNKRKFVFSFLNLIDLFAFLPFYIEKIVSTSTTATPILRVVRLTRVFRIMKVSKYVTWIRVFNSAISKSIRPLFMLLYIMLIGVVLCSTAIYFIEKDVINPFTKKYPFQSIPSSFWWSIITMTTVGYGDAVPQTPIGKFIGGITSLCGILVLALPITVISNNFNQEMEKMQRIQENPVKSIQTLRKLLNQRYRDLIKEKTKIIDEKRKKTIKRSGSIGFTEKAHSKLKDAIFRREKSIEKEKERAKSFNGSIPTTIEVSVALSPKAKNKLTNTLYNINKENIEIVSSNNNNNNNDNEINENEEEKIENIESISTKFKKSGKSVNIKEVKKLAPYLSSDDIRGILACHIVEQIVSLIEKEEKLLKDKINDLIRKQFDFLLSDLSRIFSEIPHFHGLNENAKK